MSEPKKKLSIPDLKNRKKLKEKTTLVAAGDFLMAQWAERGGVDIVGAGEPGLWPGSQWCRPDRRFR